jgi:hypothetical protein
LKKSRKGAPQEHIQSLVSETLEELHLMEKSTISRQGRVARDGEQIVKKRIETGRRVMFWLTDQLGSLIDPPFQDPEVFQKALPRRDRIPKRVRLQFTLKECLSPPDRNFQFQFRILGCL